MAGGLISVLAFSSILLCLILHIPHFWITLPNKIVPWKPLVQGLLAVELRLRRLIPEGLQKAALQEDVLDLHWKDLIANRTYGNNNPRHVVAS